MSRPSSVSRVAVHLSVLESSVAWSRSVLHAHCRICRRRGNPELMLLCDGCDRGHHTYCLKPPMKVCMLFHGGHLPGKSGNVKVVRENSACISLLKGSVLSKYSLDMSGKSQGD